MATKTPVPVAEYLHQLIKLSGKRQKEISDAVGYTNPNVVTMIKQGKTKLPINKVPAFAKVLNVDPVHLLRLTINEYMPQTWAAIEQVLGRTLLTDNERRMVEVVRKATGGKDVQLDRDQERAIAQIAREAARAVS